MYICISLRKRICERLGPLQGCARCPLLLCVGPLVYLTIHPFVSMQRFQNCLYLPICLSVSDHATVCLYLPIYLCPVRQLSVYICPFICLSVSGHASVCLYLPIYVSVSGHVSVCQNLPIYLPIRSCIHLSVSAYLSVSGHASICLYLPIYLSVCVKSCIHLSISAHLSICL